jgi:lysozyme
MVPDVQVLGEIVSYIDIARDQLKIDEGVRQKVYKDSLGIETIGVGRNLRDVGLSHHEINILLENDLVKAEVDCRVLYPSFDKLSDARKAVLLNLAFNMGRSRLAGFVKFKEALEAGAFPQAADELLNSKWAGQVGDRAVRLAKQMREG